MNKTPALISLAASLALISMRAISEPPPQTPNSAPGPTRSPAHTQTQKLTRTQNSNPQSSEVRCAAQDRAGDLWFGTTGEGVHRYDGKGFIQYTVQDGLPSNIVWSALADTDGQLWFGTDAGLCRWNGERMELVPLPPLKSEAPGTPVNPSRLAVWSLLQDSRGIIWIATGDGMFVSKRGAITPFLNDPVIANPSKLQLKMVDGMLEDRQGNIWFASGMPPGLEGLCRFDGASLTQFNPGGQRWIRTVVEDSNGTLWMGTRSGGVWRYDGNEFTPFSEKRGTGSPMLVDHAGNIWFGGEEDNSGLNLSGVWRYDGKTFENFKIGNGFGGYGCWSITQDRNGNIWMGTRNTGLYRFDGKGLIYLSE
ncbi:MAG: ligand-binding sensor domain-containing protein [Phycisphaerales bacterium]